MVTTAYSQSALVPALNPNVQHTYLPKYKNILIFLLSWEETSLHDDQAYIKNDSIVR